MTTTSPSPRADRAPRSTRPRLLVGGLAGAAALVLAAPLAASAHVHVTPEDADAGASTRLTFSFSHGCEQSPTTALEFTIPDGVDAVTPVVDGAWIIDRRLGDGGVADQVVYTAVAPIEDGLSAAVAMDVVFASAVAHSEVAFPVRQLCADGETDWSEVAEDGQDAAELESPAPVVAVGDVAAAAGGHGHGGSVDDADPVARWLSGGALVAAVAALAVALVGLRRRRA